MFGYVVPNQKQLKEEELEEYRAWYCGLCRCLQTGYGIAGRFSLGYDMTFLGILLSSLYEPEITTREGTCIAHPFVRQRSYRDVYLEYAADMNILMTYYKCLDDWKDDCNYGKAAYGLALRRGGRRVAAKYPRKAREIAKCLKKLSAAEQEGVRDIDCVAGLFGKICGCLFAFRGDEWHKLLYRFGFYLGKFIYLMDAWEDWEEDLKKKRYNPLLLSFGRHTPVPGKITAGMEQKVYEALTMMMAEACRCFERLPIIENAGILRNILYSGVWYRYYQVKEKRERTRKGQDDDRSVSDIGSPRGSF